MKRFWTEVRVERGEGGYGILLDGRPVRTPARNALLLPTAALADAVADEWRGVVETLRPDAMPMTGMANAAIDVVAPDVAGFAGTLARYAGTDLTCYRAEGPQPLVARQVAAWEPMLKAVEARHGLLFRRTAGILPVAQPEETLAKVQACLNGLDAWRLVALQPVVVISGSVVLGLALLDGVVTAEACFASACIDDDWQVEQWGTDTAAAAQQAARRRDFMAAARFLQLSSTG